MQSPIAVAALMEIAKTRTREEEGQDLLEYGLLMALIAIVAIAGVSQVGKTIYNVFWQAIANNF
jgi:Flp pilus assembly pilin Flp